MASTNCAKCGRKLTPFNRSPLSPDTHQNCDQVTKGLGDREDISQDFQSNMNIETSLNLDPSDSLVSSTRYRSHEAKVAIQSARLVNTYGTLIQVFGIICLFTNIGGGYYLTNYSGNVGWVVGGVISGLVVLFLCAVQGALFRLISNYAVAQLNS